MPVSKKSIVAKTWKGKVMSELATGDSLAMELAEKTNADKVETILTKYVGTRHHVRIFYGDALTGRDSADEWGMNGYLSRSTGIRPCLLMVANANCIGGSAIHTESVLRIIVERLEVYRHPLYQEIKWVCQDKQPYDADVAPDGRVLPFQVYRDGELHAQFETDAKRCRWLVFMAGKRMSK
jgi:hypothetical protein